MAGGPGIRRLVVGVDGSEHASYALTWAMRMAHGMGSEIVAVFAISPPLYFDLGYTTPPVEFDPQWRAEIEKEFEEKWCADLRSSGLRFRTVIEDGRAASVLSKVADEVDADIILTGRRGRGGVSELLLGSVSHELVLHSKRPVLVISSAPPASSPGSTSSGSR